MDEFLNEVRALRARTRKSIDEGPITDAQGADAERIIYVLNQALATKLACVRRYKDHYFVADVLGAQSVAEEFLQQSGEEADQADMIAARIHQLGGEPDFSWASTTRHALEAQGTFELDSLVREDILAERVALATFAEIVAWLENCDPLSKQMIEGIIAVEEEHAEDMLDLLAGIA